MAAVSPEAVIVTPILTQPDAIEYCLDSRDASEWVAVNPLSQGHFKLLKHPHMGLGLRLGCVYSAKDLINRCQADFSKIRELESHLTNPESEFFQAVLVNDSAPAPKTQPGLPINTIVDELKGAQLFADPDEEFLGKAAALVQKHIAEATEAPILLKRFFQYSLKEALESDSQKAALKGVNWKETATFLTFADSMERFDSFTKNTEALNEVARAISTARGGVTHRKLWAPIRFCLTADLLGPQVDMGLLFHILSLTEQSEQCRPLIEVVPLRARLAMLREANGLSNSIVS